ncbi:MAG: LuxR family transcriptional regulator [Intrasporangium sp.]|uniref:LuxR family transcriptional regulator n=1 Tax=Intrasporangium sp. TaxID=1925024 RepID=UPI00264787A3|nr:LuxR family transcriptional regulator [Intrasporangium sp.]MDN5794894.1 LuxR family transcriptional regulator [Intrasporangium sp.]
MTEGQAPSQVHSLGDLVPVSSRHHDAASAGIVDLAEAAREAIEAARASKHGKGTRVLWTGPHQRLVVVGLTAGAKLAEHASPPAASLQVLAGTVRLCAGDEAEWVVRSGEVVAIPPERHAVDAVTESAFVLTVSLDPHGAL